MQGALGGVVKYAIIAILVVTGIKYGAEWVKSLFVQPEAKEWKAHIRVNTDGDDLYTDQEYISYGTNEIHFHIFIDDGPEDKTITLQAVGSDNNGREFEFVFDGEYGIGDKADYYRYTTNGSAYGKGKLTVKYYDLNTGQYLCGKTIEVK